MTAFLEKLNELKSQSRKAIQIEKRYENLPVNIPEMYIRPEIAIKLIEALKKAVETLDQTVSWCLDHEKCQVAECHFARETLQEIEEMFK